MGAFAVIDCGSYSFHLLVVRLDAPARRWEGLARDKAILRLGETPSGEPLPTEAAERALEVLARFKRRAAAHGARRLVAVATSALREASDGEPFLGRAAREVGVPLRLLTGVEEARLIHRGVAGSGALDAGPAAIIDIGGGSTEVVVGTASALLFGGSMPLGAVRLTRRFGAADAPAPVAYEALCAHVDQTLRPLTASARAVGFGALIGTSGLIRNLVSMDAARRGLARQPGHALSRERLAELEASLRGMSRAERLEVAGLSRQRATDVLAGARVLLSAMTQLGATELTTCDRAMREGLLEEALDAERRAFLPFSPRR